MKRVYMAFSTDIIHSGHINIINRAAELGEITAGVMTNEVVSTFDRYPVTSLEERIKVTKRVAEGQNLIRLLFTGMDHDAICPSPDICFGPGQRILHTLFQNEAFDAGDDHKFPGLKRCFPSRDLLAELLYTGLFLLCACAKKGIFLKAHLIFNNNGRYAHPLQCADIIDKMLCQAAGIPIENNGLGGHLHDLIYGLEAGGRIHQLDIGLALHGGIAEAGDPHTIELTGLQPIFHAGSLHDECAQAAMRL